MDENKQVRDLELMPGDEWVTLAKAEKAAEEGNGNLYVRHENGRCEWLPADKAIQQWLGEDGYRITIPVGEGIEIVLRRLFNGVTTHPMIKSVNVSHVSVEVRWFD